jgi:hypothetical protein
VGKVNGGAGGGFATPATAGPAPTMAARANVVRVTAHAATDLKSLIILPRVWPGHRDVP